MAGSTPVPFEGVSVLLSLSDNGYSSTRIVHLTGEHFGIISGEGTLEVQALFKRLRCVERWKERGKERPKKQRENS